MPHVQHRLAARQACGAEPKQLRAAQRRRGLEERLADVNGSQARDERDKEEEGEEEQGELFARRPAARMRKRRPDRRQRNGGGQRADPTAALVLTALPGGKRAQESHEQAGQTSRLEGS